MEKMRKVIAVDLDGTLAEYSFNPTKKYTPDHIGKPIPQMVKRVKRWLERDIDVVIFTARAWPLGTDEAAEAPDRNSFDEPESYLRAQYQFEREDGGDSTATARTAIAAIEKWCQKHIGQVLPVTCIKTPAFIEIWDDRAVEVRANTGEPVNPEHL